MPSPVPPLPSLRWPALALPLAVLAMWAAAYWAVHWLAGAAGALYAAAVLAAAVAAQRRMAGVSAGEGASAAMARRNAGLMALVYAWGAGAILGAYTLAGLRWYHYWQYGGAMALVATGLLAYAAALRSRESALATPAMLRTATGLALLQGAFAAGGLAFLAGSGKLAGTRPDWLANHVFLFGGIAVTALSAMALASRPGVGR